MVQKNKATSSKDEVRKKMKRKYPSSLTVSIQYHLVFISGFHSREGKHIAVNFMGEGGGGGESTPTPPPPPPPPNIVGLWYANY